MVLPFVELGVVGSRGGRLITSRATIVHGVNRSSPEVAAGNREANSNRARLLLRRSCSRSGHSTPRWATSCSRSRRTARRPQGPRSSPEFPSLPRTSARSGRTSIDLLPAASFLPERVWQLEVAMVSVFLSESLLFSSSDE